MKNTNLIINRVKQLFALSLLGLMLVSTTGCPGDKKSNSANNRYGYGYYGRYGTPGYGGFGTVSNVSAGIESSGRAMLILATATEPSSGGGLYGSGQTFVEGELDVFTPMGCTMNYNLGLEPGAYQLIPYQGASAMLDIDWLTNVVLIAQGPYSDAIITIPYAKIFQTQVCGFNGMMGSMTIETVNGMPCGIYTGFSDQAGYNQCGP